MSNKYANNSKRRIMAFLWSRKILHPYEYADYEALFQITGLSQRQLRKIMNALEKDGYVKIDWKYGKKTYFCATDKDYAKDMGYDHEEEGKAP